MDEKEYPKLPGLRKPPGYSNLPEFTRMPEYSATAEEFTPHPPELIIPGGIAGDSPVHTSAKTDSKFSAKMRTYILTLMAGASIVAGVKSFAPEMFEEMLPMRRPVAVYLENYNIAVCAEDAADAERMAEHELWHQVFGAPDTPYYGVFENEEALVEAFTLTEPEEEADGDDEVSGYEYNLDLPVHEGDSFKSRIWVLDSPTSAVMRVVHEGEISYHILDGSAAEINAPYDIITDDDGHRIANISFFGNGAAFDAVLSDSNIDEFVVLRCSNERNLYSGKQSFSIVVKVNNR